MLRKSKLLFIFMSIFFFLLLSYSVWASTPGSLKWSYKSGGLIISSPAIGSEWSKGLVPTMQFHLHQLEEIMIMNKSLPVGDHTFFFAIDDNADGQPDATWLDRVDVKVE